MSHFTQRPPRITPASTAAAPPCPADRPRGSALSEFRSRIENEWRDQRRVTWMDGPPPEVSIVLPVLNESAGLPQLVTRLDAALAGVRHEVIFVDDGSTDLSWSIIGEAVESRPSWRGLRLSRRFGHQSALMAGIAAARGRAVITLDSDGQHPPDLLPRMIDLWRRGASVVQMVRADPPRTGVFKRATSRAFYRAFGLMCERPIRPGTADFRLLDRRVVDAVLSIRGPTPFLRGLIPWMGFDTVEVEYAPASRIAGRTQFSLGRMARLALDGLLSFSIVPLRLGIWVGLTIGILSLVYLCYIAGVGLLSPRAVPGWASIAGLVALLGGVQLFCVGLLGEYLGRLYLGHLDRPRYIVREAVGNPCGATRPVSMTALSEHERRIHGIHNMIGGPPEAGRGPSRSSMTPDRIEAGHAR